MFDSITGRLSGVIKTLRGQARLTESNVQEALREVRMALLEADVALPVVKDFIAHVKERALGEEVVGSLTPGQALVGVVYDELTVLMGAANVPLDLAVLIRRLLLLIGGAVVAAGLLRWILGEARIRAHKASFDGLGVVMYFVFAVAAMDGVLAAAVATPWRVASFLGLAFAMSIAGFGLSMLLLRTLPMSDRFVLGYATGQRNMGLLVAALGASTPDTTFLFFALAQFPIYMMPQIVKPLARRLAPQAAPVAPAGSP